VAAHRQPLGEGAERGRQLLLGATVDDAADLDLGAVRQPAQEALPGGQEHVLLVGPPAPGAGLQGADGGGVEGAAGRARGARRLRTAGAVRGREGQREDRRAGAQRLPEPPALFRVLALAQEVPAPLGELHVLDQLLRRRLQGPPAVGDGDLPHQVVEGAKVGAQRREAEEQEVAFRSPRHQEAAQGRAVRAVPAPVAGRRPALQELVQAGLEPGRPQGLGTLDDRQGHVAVLLHHLERTPHPFGTDEARAQDVVARHHGADRRLQPAGVQGSPELHRAVHTERPGALLLEAPERPLLGREPVPFDDLFAHPGLSLLGGPSSALRACE
jgi:hypothetical protein